MATKCLEDLSVEFIGQNDNTHAMQVGWHCTLCLDKMSEEALDQPIHPKTVFFKTRAAFNDHFFRTCHICQEEFSSRLAATAHKATHRDQKRVDVQSLCSLCGQTFGTRDEFKLHSRTHQPYRCAAGKKCDGSATKVFQSSKFEDYKQHIQECEGYKSSFRLHLGVVFGVRCIACPFKSLDMTSLYKHLRNCESAIAYDLARLEGGSISREELLKGIPTDFQDSDPHFVEASSSMATKKANLTFSGLGSEEAVLSQVTPKPLSHQLKAYSQPKKTQEVAKVDVVVKDTVIDPQGQTLPQRKRKTVSETEEAPKPKRRMTIHGGSHFETNKPGPAQSQPRQSKGAAHKRVLDQTSQSQSKPRKSMKASLSISGHGSPAGGQGASAQKKCSNPPAAAAPIQQETTQPAAEPARPIKMISIKKCVATNSDQKANNNSNFKNLMAKHFKLPSSKSHLDRDKDYLGEFLRHESYVNSTMAQILDMPRCGVQLTRIRPNTSSTPKANTNSDIRGTSQAREIKSSTAKSKCLDKYKESNHGSPAVKKIPKMPYSAVQLTPLRPSASSTPRAISIRESSSENHQARQMKSSSPKRKFQDIPRCTIQLAPIVTATPVTTYKITTCEIPVSEDNQITSQAEAFLDGQKEFVPVQRRLRDRKTTIPKQLSSDTNFHGYEPHVTRSNEFWPIHNDHNLSHLPGVSIDAAEGSLHSNEDNLSEQGQSDSEEVEIGLTSQILDMLRFRCAVQLKRIETTTPVTTYKIIDCELPPPENFQITGNEKTLLDKQRKFKPVKKRLKDRKTVGVCQPFSINGLKHDMDFHGFEPHATLVNEFWPISKDLNISLLSSIQSNDESRHSVESEEDIGRESGQSDIDEETGDNFKLVFVRTNGSMKTSL